ncbi:MAG: hypothetical protein J7J82_02730 [Staphylothermus sp.]|nr:hypothetical protein [Staphylothermus sp.]
MKLYVDTIVLNEIKDAMSSGFVYGITSNPFLFKNGLKKPYRELIEELAPYVKNEFHVQVPGRTHEEYIRNAHRIYDIDPGKIFVKIPASREGIKAMKALKETGVRITATAVTSVTQAIVLALLGADYVAPFVTRLDESGYDGLETLKDIIEIYRNHNVKTKILAASIRTSRQVIEAYRLGAYGVTVKYSLFAKLIDSPASQEIIKQMDNIWDKTPLGW